MKILFGTTPIGIFVFITFFLISAPWAREPFNDRSDDSVLQVKKYLQETLSKPDSVVFFSWTPVYKLENGNFRVKVDYGKANRYGRKIHTKQIFILSPTGDIIKILTCR